jgi:hypothetical protein
LDFENAVLKPNCFQTPDEVGRILVPNSALLYIPITYDNKEIFALIDTGVGRTKYLSSSCLKKDTFQGMNEYGNPFIEEGERTYTDILIYETTLPNIAVDCIYTDFEKPLFIIGANFFTTNIKSIGFNFQYNTFTLSIK